ncbi:MAG TPA: glutamyl-tRNA reductase [Thermoanaerobaculia bacterium]|nr:glutamyl-tRNA reductase [Thermoanaerobaculia bacterium]
MSLVLIGVNHKTAPVEVRERVSVSERESADILALVRGGEGVSGATILSTCNRVEILVSASHDDVVEPLVALLSSRAGLSAAEIERHLYVLRHADVIRHLFRVAAGLDSMIVGEPQIGGQVRSSYHQASYLETLDPTLQKLYETTLHVAKRIRSETGIGEHAVSVPFAAVELARKIFGDLAGLRVLVIGAGEMGEATAEYLQDGGLERVFVANRSFDRAVELASRFRGGAVRFDALEQQLASCDIVIASTAAPHFVITADQIARALESRRRRSIFLIDLAVPRNIDPAVASVDGAYLYNIDDLQQVVDANRDRRLQKAELAEEIVEREVELFLRRLMSQEVVPTIVELQGRLEEMRQAELERCLRKLGPISTEQRAAVESLSRGIINKVLHYPILRLKESASNGEKSEGASVRETIRNIFGLR